MGPFFFKKKNCDYGFWLLANTIMSVDFLV